MNFGEPGESERCECFDECDRIGQPSLDSNDRKVEDAELGQLLEDVRCGDGRLADRDHVDG